MKHLGGGRAPRSRRRAMRWALLVSGIAVVFAGAAATATSAWAVLPPPGGGGGGGTPQIKVSINSPTGSHEYVVGQLVHTAFVCTTSGGATFKSCTDSNGASTADNVVGAGTLNVLAPGAYTYTVTGVATGVIDGQTTTLTETANYYYGVVAPAASPPTATIASPLSGGTYAVGASVPTAFTCTEGANGPGIQTCTDSNGDTSPGALNTTTPGSHTYTVTATSQDGQTGTASISYTVAAPAASPPTATITSPASGGTYNVGASVPTAFTCTEGANGPGIKSCTDSNGDTSPGTLNTATPGNYTYTVTALSGDGQTGTASISYTVSAGSALAAPPTATITSPLSGGTYAVGTSVATAFSCTESIDGPGIQTCTDSNGDTNPGTLNTATPGNYTYTVTATSGDGLTGTASISYTVAAPAASPPTATITSPLSGGTYALNASVPTAFTCTEGTNGPGIKTCTDSNGDTSPGALNTTTPGNYTYTATATSGDGQTGTASISYTVSAAPASPPTAAIKTPVNGATYLLGQVVHASYSCTEGANGPGIASCVGPVANGAAISTLTGGVNQFTVTAISKDGQAGTATVSYTVDYATSGFVFPTVAGAGSHPFVNLAVAGHPYWLEWRLRSATGKYAGTAGATVTDKQVAKGHWDTSPSGAVAAAGTLRYNSRNGAYVFSWATPRVKGYYEVFVTLDSGQVLQADFWLV